MDATRESGIDLLKILLMFMVVVLHIIGQGGILNNCELLSVNYEISWFMEILAICAVDTFAMCSGYIMIDHEFKYNRIIPLWLQTAFYSISISALFYIYVPYSIELKDFIKAAFPVSTIQYWYFTSYFGLFFFIPYLNKMLNLLSKKEAKRLILTIIILFSLLSFYKDAFRLYNGYSFLWLGVMYIIGAYLKRFKIHITIKKSIVVYFITAFIVWLLKLISELPGKEIGQYRISEYIVSYTSPFVILMAVSLLIAFSQIKIHGKSERIIVFLSKISFGVYLIHTNPLIFKYLLRDAFKQISRQSPIILIIFILGIAAIIYILCSAIDALRYRLFKAFGIG